MDKKNQKAAHNEDEPLEKCGESTSDKNKMRYFISSENKGKIEIYPVNEDHITLNGIEDIEFFISLIQDCIREW